MLQPLSDGQYSKVDSESQYNSQNGLLSATGCSQTDFLYLYEDRWFYSQEIVKKRILARLGRFRSLFARKCIVVAVDGGICRETNGGNVYNGVSDGDIKEFIGRFHSYGYAKCKYRYALVYGGEIVAAASFSASRPMPREVMVNSCAETRIYDSYEWVRYVSLPDVRVVGGMGRLLKAFLKDIDSRRKSFRTPVLEYEEISLNPIEVMSYSDEEWSAGEVYRSLGFVEVARREPVLYYVDKMSYERLSYRKLMMRMKQEQSSFSADAQVVEECEGFENLLQSGDCRYYTIKNKGSRKFLLQLP